jgi:hypothetical protein
MKTNNVFNNMNSIIPKKLKCSCCKVSEIVEIDKAWDVLIIYIRCGWFIQSGIVLCNKCKTNKLNKNKPKNRVQSFFSKIINYYKLRTPNYKERVLFKNEIVQTYIFQKIEAGSGYIITHKKDLSWYLKSEGFVEKNQGGWTCGFIEFDDINFVIWHTMSKNKTKVKGNLQVYIDYFKTL